MHNSEVLDIAWYKKKSKEINKTMDDISWMHPTGIAKNRRCIEMFHFIFISALQLNILMNTPISKY